ncbi:MAG: helicase C-terminal domain-containing protein, partial [Ignisphaera sp.]
DVEEYGARNYLRENAVVIMFTGATTSYRERTERMFKTYSKLIETLYRAHRGGVIMVVYPSYEVMNSIVSLISSDIEMITESLKPLSQVIDEISRKEKVVVNTVAGGRLAEGIELTVNGESLIKAVVVVGVPYPQPDDYIEFIKKDLQKKGYMYIEYYRDLAIMRVLQAVGRAIRSEKDYALIVLADRRYRQKKLLEKIKLNIKTVTDSINTIEKIVSLLNQ